MVIPVILSGGVGARLWPISRESHPKPFMKLPDGQSLLHKTFLRACNLKNIAEIITVTNTEYYLKCKAEYKCIAFPQHIPLQSFLLEPVGRNTAPAIAMATLKVAMEYGLDAILLVLPADHLIDDTAAFVESCDTAIALANEERIVTFGLKPTSPETGFGYIKYGNRYLTHNAYQVIQFVEKPSAELANIYIQSQDMLWNSGMFCFKAGHLLKEFQRHCPDLSHQVHQCWNESLKSSTDSTVIQLDHANFNNIKSISIDHAVIEKSDELAVVACDFDWQDIGSWEAYKKLHPKNQTGNTVIGDVILIDSNDNFIHGDDRLIAAVGVNNLFIIDTPDALLISHRDRSQDVSKIVKELKNNLHDRTLKQCTVYRPWGCYTVLEKSDTYKVKRLTIKPGSCLSLQSHQYRSEHWIVIQGIAHVVNGDRQYELSKNNVTFVPVNTIHRISNTGESELIIIEVQSGSYLGEDDITRYEDVYGRSTTSF